jgi:hypothetical protein
MAERVEDDLVPKNVVTETTLTPPYPPLSFARLQTHQFLDWMRAVAAVWVFRKDGYQFLKCVNYLVAKVFGILVQRMAL